jgi:DNA-binding beta-propeller fold protein YncE
MRFTEHHRAGTKGSGICMSRSLYVSTLAAALVASACLGKIARAAGVSTATPAAGQAGAQTGAPSLWPGPQSDGSVLLPNQWSLRPAGAQVPLDNFPVNVAVDPRGPYAAVLHAGYGKHEIVVVDFLRRRVVWRTPVNETFYGLAFSADGSQLFCSGASDEVVHAFRFGRGRLTGHREIRVRDRNQTGVPCGLALDRRARRLFVANVWGRSVTEIDLDARARVLDILLATHPPASAPLPARASADADVSPANQRAIGAEVQTKPDGPFPYACALDEQRDRLYVSLWARAAVAVVDSKSNRLSAVWPAEEHPCEMALSRSGKFLFVANANRNTVTVLDTDAGRPIETIWAAFYPQSPPGATPNSLALSPDERTLFVANANVNAVAVFDISTPGRSRSLGFIPVGWYPTSVRVTPDGRYLLVANGKGGGSLANPLGPQPGVKPKPGTTEEYIAGMLRGTLSVIELPRGEALASHMAAWTTEACRCAPLKPDSGISRSRPDDNPVPAKPGDPSPIRYCVYIIKENRTYDQVLGDLPVGNGDSNLCLFPDRVTPNHHRLAREFVLLDNFYADAEVSASGHEWSMAAYASDFVEKTWPLNYGHAASGKFPYPGEGAFPIATPAGGYLWDRAAAAGISYRSYGEFVNNGSTTNQPVWTRVRNLAGHFDPWFRGFDLGYSDLSRADRFIAELKRFETNGDMPRLQIVRLPNDHTHGATSGYLTPTAFVAENDLALGRVVEAISHSRFWPHTAIFVVEDDSQNGPDHVDAHRTVALVISPYAKRGFVDSDLYSTTSLLRTMELILGLRPMSQFDAAAAPMFNSFQRGPDVRPYTAAPAQVDLTEKNSSTAWGNGMKMNFAREDEVDDLLLNQVIWRSVRGADSPMPAPVRAAFVRATRGDEDD